MRQGCGRLVGGSDSGALTTPYPGCLADGAGVGCLFRSPSPDRDARAPTRLEDTDRDSQHTISRLRQHRDRHHDLARHFAHDVATVHPADISGRNPGSPGDTECCGYRRTTHKHHEHIQVSNRRL